MTLLQATDLCLTLGTKNIFSNISFTINEGDRIALVGRNGCGKTSLLRILTGESEADNGTLTRRRNLVIGYAAQELPEKHYETACHDYLVACLPVHAREDSAWKVDVTLGELGLPVEQWHAPLKSLSGGWRRLMLIAGTVLQEPDLLILDEPTNHLDLGKIFRLEEWLTQQSLPMMIVSHDRAFIDRCTDKTFFMRSDGMHVFNASYSVARQNLLEADLMAARQLKKETAEIDRLEGIAKRLHDWANRSNSSAMALRAKAARQRAARIEENKTEVYKEQRSDIRLHKGDIRAQNLLTIGESDILAPDGRNLFRTPRWFLKQGERVALLGLNGAGKSVFIRKLVEAFETENNSSMVFNPQVNLGYLDQHLNHMPEKMSLYHYVSQEFALDDTATNRELTLIGFPPAQQGKAIGLLSYGEKARLALLALRLRKPNFYILDEPTNHLDIAGQEMLEEELNGKGQSCLFISHDRHLVNNTATRFLEIQKKRLVEIDDPDIFFDKVRILAEKGQID